MHVMYDVFSSLWGDMFIAKSEKGLCAALFIEDKNNFKVDDALARTHATSAEHNPPALLDVKNQLLEYFDGKRTSFDVPLDLKGTHFQEQVWQILLDIPFGEVWSYQDVAIAAGDANKVRAIGGAVGKNPVVLIVPCHRVVGKSGKLTGFSSLGGVELKQKILDHEGVNLNSGADYQIPLI